MADADTVRAYLGESIPSGGTDADTFFSDQEITDLIVAASTLYGAAAEGWRMKAAEAAMLVNTKEGTSSRDMSDLHKQYLAQAAYYDGLELTALGSRPTRSKEIVRDESTL